MARRWKKIETLRNAWYYRDLKTGEIIDVGGKGRIQKFDAEKESNYTDPILTTGRGHSLYMTTVTAGTAALAAGPTNPTAASGNPPVSNVDLRPALLTTAASTGDQSQAICTAPAASGAVFAGASGQYRLDAGVIIQARLKFGVATHASGEAFLFGLGSAAAAAQANWDAIAVNAWFKTAGTADLLVETDDATTDVDDIDTGTDLAISTTYLFEVDASNPADVIFKVNNARVAANRRFNLSAAATAGYRVGGILQQAKTSVAGSSNALTITCSMFTIVAGAPIR